MTTARLHDVDSDRILAELQVYTEKLQAVEAVKQIILFGSLARREMTEASDVDLAVIIDDAADIRLVKDEVRRLKISNFTWPCDLLVCPESWYEQRKTFGGICMEIATDGKIIFDRSKSGEKR